MASRKNGHYHFTVKYFDASVHKDPEKFIREQEDNVAQAEAFISALKEQRRKDERSNSWRVCKVFMIAATITLMIIIALSMLLNWNIIGFLACLFIGKLVLVIIDGIELGEKQDISVYDNAISNLNGYIQQQQREIDVAREACRHQSCNQDSLSWQISSLNECYRILGCSPNASNQEIRRHYRELMFEYHPDHIRAAGNGRHLADLAEEQAKKINVAYDAIKRARGLKWNL